MLTTKQLIDKLFGRSGKRAKQLPRHSVEHDSVDRMRFGNFADGSPRFRRLAIEDAPRIAPDVPDPEPIDFTTATADDIAAWQDEAKKAKEAREQAPEYDAWEDLSRDMFYGYHHPNEPNVLSPEQVDPGIAHHAKIMAKIMSTEDFGISRNTTRDNANMAAMATMATVRKLKEVLEEELVQQARDSEQFERERDSAENAMSELESLRDEAREHHEQGQQVPQPLIEQIREAVREKHRAQQQAAQTAAQLPKAFDKAAHDAVVAAAKAGAEAAQNAANLPSFGGDFGGRDEPRYESPEQALDIADKWATNRTLRAVAELYGRFDKHMRFQRAKRTVGGQDEIVDLKFGDDIRRVLPAELAFLADEDYELDFLARYLAGELRVYDTVGEENAGRGPIVLVGDESGSMSGERNVWCKAISCCLLNIARREKRDFCYVGFAQANQVYSILFPAKSQLQAQDIIEMASHFYNGGGTVPIAGTTVAKKVMDDVPIFKKADIVIVGDGEAAFTDEDKRLRDTLVSRGVRFHGIAISPYSTYKYLNEYCGEEMVVNIRDFELENPSEATAHLATHIQ